MAPPPFTELKAKSGANGAEQLQKKHSRTVKESKRDRDLASLDSRVVRDVTIHLHPVPKPLAPLQTCRATHAVVSTNNRDTLFVTVLFRTRTVRIRLTHLVCVEGDLASESSVGFLHQ